MARITEHSELLLVRSQEAKHKQYSWKGCSLENAMVSQDELSLGCQVVTQVLTDLTCFSSVSSYPVTPREPSLSVPHSLCHRACTLVVPPSRFPCSSHLPVIQVTTPISHVK